MRDQDTSWDTARRLLAYRQYLLQALKLCTSILTSSLDFPGNMSSNRNAFTDVFAWSSTSSGMDGYIIPPDEAKGKVMDPVNKTTLRMSTTLHSHVLEKIDAEGKEHLVLKNEVCE